MTSPCDTIADNCAALASKTKHKSDKARLQQLVEQWRSIAADQESEAVRRPFALVEPTASVPLAEPPAKKSGQPLRRDACCVASSLADPSRPCGCPSSFHTTERTHDAPMWRPSRPRGPERAIS
jgi:hypothetical protein